MTEKEANHASPGEQGEEVDMAKATTTIRQSLQHRPRQSDWFAATQRLFNQVAAFYFEVIQAHEGVLDLPDKADEHLADLVSARIVQFAKEQGASILVFEHLGKLKPEQGKYSKRGNSKRAFPIWWSGNVLSHAITLKRKSLPLLWQQRGSRKTQVLRVPTSRKLKLWAILPFQKGMEPPMSEAPLKREQT
jgi:hypothetical protein